MTSKIEPISLEVLHAIQALLAIPDIPRAKSLMTNLGWAARAYRCHKGWGLRIYSTTSDGEYMGYLIDTDSAARLVDGKLSVVI